MHDINDFFYFAQVVRHEGFSPAARALRISKSVLSKRVARLEAVLGARLLERSTRGLRLTTLGQEVFAQAEAIVAGVEGAEAVAMRALAAPRGIVRFACPPGMAYGAVTSILPAFMRAYPEVRIAMAVSNRRVDLVEDGFDLALRVRERLEGEASVVARQLGQSRRILVASPAYFEKRPMPQCLDALAGAAVLSIGDEIRKELWTFVTDNGAEHGVQVDPILASSDFRVLLDAAVEAIGIALLPQNVCRGALEDRRLIQVLSEWHSKDSIVHLVFASRRGLLPATRAFIDFLVAELPSQL